VRRTTVTVALGGITLLAGIIMMAWKMGPETPTPLVSRVGYAMNWPIAQLAGLAPRPFADILFYFAGIVIWSVAWWLLLAALARVRGKHDTRPA
jgi:hypothetical protein